MPEAGYPRYLRRRAPARVVLRYHSLLFADGSRSAGAYADSDSCACPFALPGVSARDDVAAGSAWARGAAANAMPRHAYACAVPYSDAMPQPRSHAAAGTYACAVPGAVANTDALPNAYAVRDAYAVPDARAVPDAHASNAGAGPVSAILPIPAAPVPYNAGAVPHAASPRVP